MPKVSVIIPVYNVEQYLGECLDSVIGQTLKDIEIICVDDGSTDSSPKMLADYAAKDSRIKVITQPNGGQSVARNTGMEAASGTYIYFLDSDDWIVPETLERGVEICERDDLDQLVFGCRGLFEDPSMSEETCRKNARNLSVPPEVTGKIMSGPALVKLFSEMKRHSVHVMLRLCRREMLVRADVRFCVGLIHEDDYFTPLSLLESRRVEVIRDEFYVRRYRPGSTVTTRGLTAEAKRFASRVAVYLLQKRESSERGYDKKHPDVIDAFFRCERSRLEKMAKPRLALLALLHKPSVMGFRDGVAFALLDVELMLRRIIRRIRRRLWPATR